jgi:hypothetical protein
VCIDASANVWLFTHPIIFFFPPSLKCFFHLTWNVFSTTLRIKLGLFHLLILGVSHCIYSQPLDPMGIHFFHYVHCGEGWLSIMLCEMLLWPL